MKNFTPLRKFFETTFPLCILMGLSVYAGYGQVVVDTVFAEHDVTLGSGENFKATSMDGGQLQMCNFDDAETLMSYFESWMKFNFTELAANIPEGQDVLYASCVFRVSANAGPQGARFFHLYNIDDWDQATLSWDEAQTLDYENEANYDQFTELLPEDAGGTSARPEINVTEQVLYELGESGNLLFTLRAEPYVKEYIDNDPYYDKKWLGFYSREVTWDDDGDPATMNVYCPQIILYIGPPEPKVFSDDADFGTIENYDLTPDKYGYWLVRDDEGDARLKIDQRPAPINGTPGGVAVYNMETYGDFDIKLKAKLNKLSGGALDPKADFIVVFGYEGPMDYSYMRFTGEDINGFYLVDTTGGNTVTEIGDLNTTPALTDTMYHDYRLVREGTTVTAYIDDVEYMSVTDDALGTEGMIGMGSYNDIALFDDFMEGEASLVKDLLPLEMTIYPNPAGDKLHIDAANGMEKLVISNIVGQEIQTIDDINSASVEINVSSFETGIYFITVHGMNNGVATRKFIKK